MQQHVGADDGVGTTRGWLHGFAGCGLRRKGEESTGRKPLSRERNPHQAMTAHERVVDTARRARKYLHLIAGLYVLFGLALSARSAFRGDILSALLGLLIVTGALGAAWVLISALHLGVRMSAMRNQFRDVFTRLDRIEKHLAGLTTTSESTASFQQSQSAPPPPPIPEELIAAIFDEPSYPRLALAEDTSEPPEEPAVDRASAESSTSPAPIRFADDGSANYGRNLAGEWRNAIESGDVSACRALLAEFESQLSGDALEHYREEFLELLNGEEDRLRADFSTCVKRRDFDGALRVGAEIVARLPDSGIAADFLKLRPRLRELAAAGAPQSNRVAMPVG